MKSFMILILLLIVAGTAGYFLNYDFRKMVDEQVIYGTGYKSHESHGYKWKDQDGVWQLTQTPPAEGIKYEKVKVRDDWNVVDVPDSLK